jgi:ATP-dependent Clp protease adaptor protein ClpS
MVETFEEIVVRTVPREQTRTETKRQPPYAVILHNDPVNGFGYVVDVLRKVFGYGRSKAYWLTLKAHCTGRSIIWVGALEVAEFKAEQLRACGPDPDAISAAALPLGVSIEPLPSD